MSNYVHVERALRIEKNVKEDGTFEAYASVFDVEDSDGHVIKPGAFKAGLEKLKKNGQLLKMLWHHNRHEPIGVYTHAEEDSKGLFVVGKYTKGVQRSDETRLLMLDGAIDSVSIGGYVTKADEDRKTYALTIHELELREISPVSFPALDQARVVSVKSLADGCSIRDVERTLRDAGFSISDAKRIISVTKGATPREAATDPRITEALSILRSINQ